jgi:tRNA threonylcarbamoyladenosine biosynthesis protein TsaB
VIVLGFDTATQASAVGLRLSDGRTLRASDDPAAGEHPGHATRLLAMARELLVQAEVRWDELDRIAVGVGPGRFTGLRVGIATARGLAQSLGAQLVGVSSLRALALAATREAREMDARETGETHESETRETRENDRTPPPGTIAVIDARRGESFIAAYPPTADFAALAGAAPGADLQAPGADLQACGGEIAFERALRPDELSDVVIAQIEQRGAAPGQRWRAVGDGALLYADALRDGGVELAPPDSPLHLIDGAAICELAAAVPAAVLRGARESVLPDYRRSPDAALARPAASRPAPAAGQVPATSTPGPVSRART